MQPKELLRLLSLRPLRGGRFLYRQTFIISIINVKNKNETGDNMEPAWEREKLAADEYLLCEAMQAIV